MQARELIPLLKQGRSFRRPLENGGYEYVLPRGNKEFGHWVDGDGWGGYNELPFDFLTKQHWNEDPPWTEYFRET